MTIALGILAKDGLVIAADTEVGDGLMRYSEGKIAYGVSAQHSAGKLASFALAGAGNGSYLVKLHHQMIDVFHESYGTAVREAEAPWTPEAFEARLQSEVAAFHANHIAPLATLPDTTRPDVWLLMGVQERNKSLLWTTEHSVLTPRLDYAAVGIGASQAKVLLEWIDTSALDRKTAAILAVYIIFRVKSVVSCGLETDVVCLSSQEPFRLSREHTRELEQIFRRCAEFESRTLLRVLGTSESPNVLSREARGLRREIAKIADLLN